MLKCGELRAPSGIRVIELWTAGEIGFALRRVHEFVYFVFLIFVCLKPSEYRASKACMVLCIVFIIRNLRNICCGIAHVPIHHS